MHQKICTRHTTVSVYSDAKTIFEARRHATALLGVVQELQCSSSQSEPDGFCSICLKTLNSLTLMSSTKWRPRNLVDRLLKHPENCCHLPCPTHQRCQQWPNKVAQRAASTLLLKLAVFSLISNPRILNPGLGRKK